MNPHNAENGTLDAAIATHPQLWARMVELAAQPDQAPYVAGMVEALCIVGKFDQLEVWDRLQ